MYLFLSPPKFTDFIRDPDTHQYLNIVQHMDIPDKLLELTLGSFLQPMLMGLYDMGDISRMGLMPYNFLFCISKSQDGELQINKSALTKCLTTLGECVDQLTMDEKIILVLPNFKNESILQEFTNEFSEIYADSEMKKTVAVMTVDSAKRILNLKKQD